MSQLRISILAIGTELTTGQIINRNASWISSRLSEMGVQTSGHFTVPDDRPLIQKTMDLCSETSDLIFVTGGLGPTSDDFTREMIRDWTGLPLEWHEPSWTHLTERLRSRGLAVKEIQKQQCYFPMSAEVLTNSSGTANGFRVTAKGKTFIVLPGPPREIEAIWKDHLAGWLPTQFPGLDPWITRSWETIGQPESQIAQLTEEALAETDLERGYRVHVPYVEVKLSFPKSRSDVAAPFVEKITRTLSGFTVLRDGEEVSQKLGKALTMFPSVLIIDQISGDYLFNRLQPQLGALWKSAKMSLTNFDLPATEDTLILKVESIGSGEARASLSYQGNKKSDLFTAPYQSAQMKEREKQYLVEMSALFWARELAEL